MFLKNWNNVLNKVVKKILHYNDFLNGKNKKKRCYVLSQTLDKKYQVSEIFCKLVKSVVREEVMVWRAAII